MKKLKEIDNDENSAYDEFEKFRQPALEGETNYMNKNFLLKQNDNSNQENEGIGRKSGNERVYDIKMMDYSQVIGDDTYVLVTMSDITKKLEKEQAHLAAKNKDTLICSVSHEIRTPLNHIFGNSLTIPS